VHNNQVKSSELHTVNEVIGVRYLLSIMEGFLIEFGLGLKKSKIVVAYL
jgi:hypothetical protein